ncbi:MAG TPA: carboxypeptidase regulatory-like domain-containing protein [Vicinamibacterales bacterium]
MWSGLRTRAVWLAFVCIWAAPPPAMTQTVASASVTGTVRDSSDALVPGATVEIRNHATNQTWQTVTDAKGQFRLSYLPAGDYHLSVQLSGFGTTNAGLTLAVRDQVDVPIVLKPAAVAESVQVAAPAPLVEARRTEMASTITPGEVNSLPLNGRNYLDLALLAPNVSRTNLKTTDRFAETSAVAGTGVSVAGQRNLNNNFVLDGLSANDDAADLAGVSLSQEVVREFEVVTAGGGAEFGRASSGTISVITQSGTNRYQGRAYEFFRDDVFDTQNPLATRKDPLSQNQFGFTLGGPIVKNRTFWFGNVEQTLQDRTGVVTIAPESVTAVNAALDAAGYHGPRIATGNFPTGYDSTNLFGRVDHQATPASNLQLRYLFYHVTSDNARNVGGLGDVSRGTALDDTDQTGAVNYLLTLSSGAINEARAQYTHSRLGAPVNDTIGPAVSISGVANFGVATSSPTERDADVFQAVDTLTLQRGSHLIKTGAELLYNRVNIVFPGALQGSYTFSSLATFQRGIYSQYQQAFGVTSLLQSNPNLGLFAQDEWRVRSNFTIDAGLRYDLQWLPSPIQLDANNVSPRIGAAYSPGDGKTVIRGSAGLYFDRIPLRATSNAIQRDGTIYQTAVLSFGQAGAPAWPNVLPVFPAGVLVSISNINPNVQNQYNEQAGVQIERAIGSSLSAQFGYTYMRGHGILMSRNVNVPTLTAAQAAVLGVANLGRPDPRYGNISQYDALGDSWFHGFTASLDTRHAPWGRARVSYTLSNAQDDSGNAFFQTPQTQNDILADKGPSDNDQRQRLVIAGTVGDGTSAAVRRALAGFQIGWVYSYATAAPFNIVTGADNNNDTTVNDRPAGVGRNSGRFPCYSDLNQICGTTSFDVRISRVLALGGAHRLELMLEGFNLFNHVNVVNVNNTIGNTPTPSPTFEQVTAVGDMRQFQLGARWSF